MWWSLWFPDTVPYVQESEMETEEEVDILMSSDVYSATLSTKSITFSRAQTGWLFREDKTVSAAVVFAAVVLMTSCLSPPQPFQSQLWVSPGPLLVEFLVCPRQEDRKLIYVLRVDGKGKAKSESRCISACVQYQHACWYCNIHIHFSAGQREPPLLTADKQKT